MPTRTSKAVWEGTIEKGRGQLEMGSGSCSPSYSFASRFENGAGTNPEELLAAAHAGCFAMALSLALGRAGFQPERVEAEAAVTIERSGDGFTIRSSALTCEARVPGLDAVTFAKHAEAAKSGCPVSKALAGVDITLEARLAE